MQAQCCTFIKARPKQAQVLTEPLADVLQQKASPLPAFHDKNTDAETHRYQQNESPFCAQYKRYNAAQMHEGTHTFVRQAIEKYQAKMREAAFSPEGSSHETQCARGSFSYKPSPRASHEQDCSKGHLSIASGKMLAKTLT